jgi:hypothetical protein
MSKDKRFIIRKYVMAPTAQAAIEREHAQPVDEVYLDTPPESARNVADAIGFHQPQEREWRDDEIRGRRRH